MKVTMVGTCYWGTTSTVPVGTAHMVRDAIPEPFALNRFCLAHHVQTANQDLQPGVASGPAHLYPPRRRNSHGRLRVHAQPLTMLELAPLVPELTGSASVSSMRRSPATTRCCASPTPARRGRVGWGPRVMMRKALGRTVAWFRTLTEFSAVTVG